MTLFSDSETGKKNGSIQVVKELEKLIITILFQENIVFWNPLKIKC